MTSPPRKIRLISVPYHLGREGSGMGAGPARLLAAGIEGLLSSDGQATDVELVELPGSFEHEIGAYFEVQRALAGCVRAALKSGDFPFVLGGNCGCVLGATAGLGLGDRGGVVWFDAHGDLNTPETTTSGFLDGMPFAVLTGHCWTNLAASIPGFTGLPADRVLLSGARSLDDGERDLLDTCQLPFVGPDGLGGPGSDFEAAVRDLGTRVDSVHVHIDLDVIDVSDGRANEFAAAGGPPLDALEAAVRVIGDQAVVNSVSLTSYNPACDEDDRALAAGLRLATVLSSLTAAH
jgi:arginase